jgi:hypothetical protein
MPGARCELASNSHFEILKRCCRIYAAAAPKMRVAASLQSFLRIAGAFLTRGPNLSNFIEGSLASEQPNRAAGLSATVGNGGKFSQHYGRSEDRKPITIGGPSEVAPALLCGVAQQT